MDCVSDPSITEIVVMAGAQVFKTEFLINTVGYFSDYDPCPIMLMQPTEQMAEAFSNDRISPSIRDTPAMRAAFGDPKAKVSGNTILHKKFAGGHLTMVGSNSPASLASRPIRVLLCDEIDRYPASAGREGDPVGLAIKRTTTFWNRKVILVSTPTIKGSSRIEKAFELTDQRYYHIPCPRGCGHTHRLLWSNVVWGENTPAKGDWRRAVFQCPGCQKHYSNAEKNNAVRDGHWVATAPFYGRAGFHLSQLYAPWQGSRLEELIKEMREAKGNPEQHILWVNTVLGETFEIGGDRLDDNELAERAENFPTDSEDNPLIPDRVLTMTAGADTQPDRIEAELVGWAAGEESWALEYEVFRGDPDIPEGQEGSPWDAFTEWLRRPRRNAQGIEMKIARTAIDTGGQNTQAVYNYVKRHQRTDKIIGIKGVTGQDRPIIGNASRKKTGRKGRPIDLYLVGHDAAKSMVVGRLKITDPGPGYCRFPTGRDSEYFRQLTSEKFVTRYVKGRPKREWVPIEGRRNEALDCRCYATAALMHEAPRFSLLALRRKRRLEALEAARTRRSKPRAKEDPFHEPEPEGADEEVATDDTDTTGEPETDAVAEAQQQIKMKRGRTNPRKRRGGGWIQSW